jgi:hypothetical protein
MPWRTFTTEAEAQAFADECWVRFVAQRDDGSVRVVLADGEAQIVALGRRADDGELVTDEGWTTAWDVPRQTADGRWAVQALPGDDGELEPEWPAPPPLL